MTASAKSMPGPEGKRRTLPWPANKTTQFTDKRSASKPASSAAQANVEATLAGCDVISPAVACNEIPKQSQLAVANRVTFWASQRFNAWCNLQSSEPDAGHLPVLRWLSREAAIGWLLPLTWTLSLYPSPASDSTLLSITFRSWWQPQYYHQHNHCRRPRLWRMWGALETVPVKAQRTTQVSLLSSCKSFPYEVFLSLSGRPAGPKGKRDDER